MLSAGEDPGSNNLLGATPNPISMDVSAHWEGTLVLLWTIIVLLIPVITRRNTLLGVMVPVGTSVLQKRSMKIVFLFLFLASVAKTYHIAKDIRLYRCTTKLKVSKKAHRRTRARLDRTVAIGKLLGSQSSAFIAAQASTIASLGQKLSARDVVMKTLKASRAAMQVEFSYYMWCSERDIDKLAATNSHLDFLIAGLKDDVANGLRKIQLGEEKNDQLLADFMVTLLGSEKRLENKDSKIKCLEFVNLRQQDELQRLREELELCGLREEEQRSAKVLRVEDLRTSSEESDDHATRPPTPSTDSCHSRCCSLDSLPTDRVRRTSETDEAALVATAAVSETAWTLAPDVDSAATLNATSGDSNIVADIVTDKACADVLITEVALDQWWFGRKIAVDDTVSMFAEGPSLESVSSAAFADDETDTITVTSKVCAEVLITEAAIEQWWTRKMAITAVDVVGDIIDTADTEERKTQDEGEYYENEDGDGQLSSEEVSIIGDGPASSSDDTVTGSVEALAVSATEGQGLARYAGVDWVEGAIQDLFMANMIDMSGSADKATLMKNIMGIVNNHAERLTVHQVLGRGTCGKVEGVEFADFPGECFALKTVNHGADKYVKQSALLEMVVFARLVREPHDNVIAALAVDDTSASMPVLLPKAKCNLATLLDDDTVAIGDKLGLVIHVARAAQHLHGMNIVHRDITPGNVLVFESEELGLHCKLADFGLSREIGEVCPAMSGTPGFMAYESMAAEPVTGAAGQDVVAVAMVLLTICLRKEHRSANLFAKPALVKPEEFARLKDMVHRMTRLGEDVSLQRELFQVELTRRTMGDGSFAEMMLSSDKMDPTLKCPEMLIEALPAFLATTPDDRDDMGSLLALVERLAKINTDS